jgi:hypothetical protein
VSAQARRVTSRSQYGRRRARKTNVIHSTEIIDVIWRLFDLNALFFYFLTVPLGIPNQTLRVLAQHFCAYHLPLGSPDRSLPALFPLRSPSDPTDRGMQSQSAQQGCNCALHRTSTRDVGAMGQLSSARKLRPFSIPRGSSRPYSVRLGDLSFIIGRFSKVACRSLRTSPRLDRAGGSASQLSRPTFPRSALFLGDGEVEGFWAISRDASARSGPASGGEDWQTGRTSWPESRAQPSLLSWLGGMDKHRPSAGSTAHGVALE